MSKPSPKSPSNKSTKPDQIKSNPTTSRKASSSSHSKQQSKTEGKSSLDIQDGIQEGANDPTLVLDPQELDTSAHKFDLRAPEEAPPSQDLPAYEDLGDLPHHYGTKKLFLTARDPQWLYASWDISHEDLCQAEASSHDGKVFLQLYHEAGDRTQQIQISPWSKEWCLHVNEPDTTFYAEIGFYNQSEIFEPISRSKTTTTPRDSLSWKTDAEFVTIPFEFSFKDLFALIEDHINPGEELAEALSRLQKEGFSFPFKTGVPISLSPESHKTLLDYLSGDTVRIRQVGSGEIVDILKKQFTSTLSSGQWVSSPFSPMGSSFGAIGNSRNFFMNVNAELIIYGGTDPNATVTIDGEKIKLTPEGTFSYHFNFKDGSYHIPISAQSPDGVETRQSLLSFLRLSEHSEDVDATPQTPRSTPMGETPSLESP